MLENLRIHIIALGYNSDWIVKALEETRADKAYFFIRNEEPSEKAKKAQEEIEKFAKKKKIEYSLIKCNPENIHDPLNKTREIIEAEKNNYIYLMISAGERHNIIAFTLASILFNRIPKGIGLYSTDGKEITKIPSFEAKLPEYELIESMKFIKENGNGCSKKALVEFVYGNNLIKIGKDNYSNKLMTLNRRIVDKLLQWRFIEIEGKGKSCLIKLNEAGQNLLELF